MPQKNSKKQDAGHFFRELSPMLYAHEDLLKIENGVYRKLYELQFKMKQTKDKYPNITFTDLF